LCGGVFVLVVVLIRWASVLLYLRAIFIPVFLSRLVTFLIYGDEKVNVAHFSFFGGFVMKFQSKSLNGELLLLVPH